MVFTVVKQLGKPWGPILPDTGLIKLVSERTKSSPQTCRVYQQPGPGSTKKPGMVGLKQLKLFHKHVRLVIKWPLEDVENKCGADTELDEFHDRFRRKQMYQYHPISRMQCLFVRNKSTVGGEYLGLKVSFFVHQIMGQREDTVRIVEENQMSFLQNPPCVIQEKWAPFGIELILHSSHNMR